MGLITALAGLGSSLRDAGSLAEIFVGNKAKLEGDEHAEFIASLNQLSAEFSQNQSSWFDSFINGLNRLPRPAMALGTLGLFTFAMADPVGFAGRMQGLALVPDPLWWLLGAIVSFYFGARELHYARTNRPNVSIEDVMRVNELRERIETMRPPAAPLPDQVTDGASGKASDPNYNAAVAEWRAARTSG